jgi:hypothetical protein
LSSDDLPAIAKECWPQLEESNGPDNTEDQQDTSERDGEPDVTWLLGLDPSLGVVEEILAQRAQALGALEMRFSGFLG